MIALEGSHIVHPRFLRSLIAGCGMMDDYSICWEILHRSSYPIDTVHDRSGFVDRFKVFSIICSDSTDIGRGVSTGIRGGGSSAWDNWHAYTFVCSSLRSRNDFAFLCEIFP